MHYNHLPPYSNELTEHLSVTMNTRGHTHLSAKTRTQIYRLSTRNKYIQKLLTVIVR